METRRATNVRTLIKFPFNLFAQVEQQVTIKNFILDGNNCYATIPGSRYQVPENLKKVLIGEPVSC